MNLTGYIPAIVTPFSENSIDLQSFRKYVNWLVESGVSGIVVCGSTGESISLSCEEKRQLVSVAVEVVGNKVPVIAGIITSTTDDAMKMAKTYEMAGADGLLCVCPYYVKPTQEGVYTHIRCIHESTALPIVVYNNPGRTAFDLSVDTLRKLASLERIIGLKEASSDLSRFLCWRQHVKSDFCFLSGNDDTFCGALALGAHGTISVTCNIVPDICSDLFSAWVNRNFDKFTVLRDKIMNLHNLLFSEPSPAPTKYALSLMGIMKEDVRRPLLPLTDTNKNKIKYELEKLGLI